MFSKLSPGSSQGGKTSGNDPVQSENKETNRHNASTSKLQGKGTMVPSIIGTDLEITGNVISKGEIQIEGEISGDIHCASLVVGPKAQVNGGVKAEDIVIHGRVMGSVHGLRVSLQSSSYVEGDIYHQALSIEQGAFFEGKSRRSDDPLSLAPSHDPNITPLKKNAAK